MKLKLPTMTLTLPTKQVEIIDHGVAGRVVREKREKKNKSLRWLASQLKFSPPFMSDLERGRRNWTQEKFDKALSALA